MFPASDGVAVLLAYGEDCDWVRNLTASGGGRAVMSGKTLDFTEPRLVPTAEAPARLRRDVSSCGQRLSTQARMGPLATVVNGTSQCEVRVQRADLHRPNGRCQRQRGLQPREVFADARPPAAEEREKLPAAAAS